MQGIRTRVRESIQTLRTSEHLEVYPTLRKTWAGRGEEHQRPRRSLSDDQLKALLVDRQPQELSMDEITDLADHYSINPPDDPWSRLAVAEALAPANSPIPRDPATINEPFGGGGQTACMRLTLYLGYVAAPVAAHYGGFDDVIRMTTNLGERLASPEYAHIKGAGEGGDDGNMKLLILAPAVAGCSEHYPRNLRRGTASYNAVKRELSQLNALLIDQSPLTECVLIRWAALVCVAGLRTGASFLPLAEEVCRERGEMELAESFALFGAEPKLLGYVGRRRRVPTPQPVVAS